MGKHQANPKESGIVPNKEGTGATMMSYKVDNTHFIIVLDDSAKTIVQEIQKHPEKASEEQLQSVLSSLAVEDVYAEKLGDTASQQQLDAAFNTSDTKTVVKEIIMNGKFH
jgi:ribosome maturation protein Sdo1